MIYTLYCYNYNNYYNRIIKKENSLQDYGDYIYYEEGVNFNFSDGVNTTQVINTILNPNYIILVDEDNNINSRWFVIDANYTRNGQHVFTLHRDVIIDNYDSVLSAPMFIEKATLNDNNPLIFNSENVSVNQIKTSEYLIKDETNIPWLVGYWTGKTETDKPATGSYDIIPDIVVDTIADYNYYDYSEGVNVNYEDFLWGPSIYNYNFKVLVGAADSLSRKRAYTLNLGTTSSEIVTYRTVSTLPITGYNIRSSEAILGFPTPATIIQADNNYFNQAKEAALEQAYSYYNWHHESEVIDIKNEVNKIIYDSSTQKYYKVHVVTDIHSISYTDDIITPGSGVAVAIDTAFENTRFIAGQSRFSGDIKFSTSVHKLHLRLEEITENILTATIPAGHRKTLDQPYDIFCMPYDNYKFTIDLNEINTDRSVSFTAAMALAREYMGESAQFLYDLQLLPYCPIRKYIQPDGSMDLSDALENTDYSIIKNGDNEDKGIILFADSSSFTFTVPYTKQVNNIKLENECDKYRLCSPNYASEFEFNLAKNGGINYFDIDCTYKPYSPYIHVQPDFKVLYGTDFNDARGLICSGDFSLPAETNAWAQYELSNKNYLNSFERQVENMEINNSVQRTKEKWDISLGAVSGAVAGATSGSLVGGGIGASIGAGIGAAASVVGGIIDYNLNEQLRNEALDYTKDQFGYQLGNIRALPNTLSKVSSYTINNKIFPILEYYTCTEEEKKAVANKIAYNGMTVMAIGKIEDYIGNKWNYNDIESKNYIKGQLIRLENIEDDFHMLKSIADELNKGVFING